MSPYLKSVRVRFAPSPTGLLHIGGLRTALYNFLFARKTGGTFILRVEDTDQSRLVEEAETDILASLDWTGLAFDEGPGIDGECGPYRQSERKDLYGTYARQLVDSGHAYYAFDSPDSIEAMRTRHKSPENPAPRYDSATRNEMINSLTRSKDEVNRRIEEEEPFVIRLKVPEFGTVRFEDLIRGAVAFGTSSVDDQVLVKSDGLPTYHLANIVDDHLMGITHVIRGEEWLPSAPKHILLYQAFGWEPPTMAHLPLILSPNGGKLSKRNAEKMGIPVNVRQYREEGYEPAALINFLAMLGWNPGNEREVFELDQLVDAFSIDRVGSSGVQFNLDKLRWFNQQHLRKMPVRDILERVRPDLTRAGFTPADDYLLRVIELMRERISFIGDLVSQCRYFFEDPQEYDSKGLKKRWKKDSSELLLEYADRLEKLQVMDHAAAEETLRDLAELTGIGAGRIIHPARLAVSGVSAGPGLFDLMELLGNDVCVRRLRRAANGLG